MHFQQVQQAFVAHIKNPTLPMPEGITAERMAVYRELFFNNVQGFVSSAFPVLKSLYQCYRITECQPASGHQD